MKPFTTLDYKMHERKIIPYQCKGMECEKIWSFLKGRKIVSYGLFEGHTFQAAWGVSIAFEDEEKIIISSAMNAVDGWQEVGGLSLSFIQNERSKRVAKEVVTKISPIRIVAVDKIVYEDDELVVECGLALLTEIGRDIIFSAGVSPGSVSVCAGFLQESVFEPEFPLSMCRRESL